MDISSRRVLKIRLSGIRVPYHTAVRSDNIRLPDSWGEATQALKGRLQYLKCKHCTQCSAYAVMFVE